MRFGDATRALANSLVGNFTSKLAGQKGPGRDYFVDTVSSQPYYAPPAGDALSLAKLYNTNPWVRTIVKKVAAGVAKPKWYLEDASGNRIDKHPALEWLRAGNGKMRGRQAIGATVTYMDLQGECFWVLGRNGAKPAEYAPIPSHWVVTLPYEGFAFYTLQPKNGRTFDMPADQVLHFKDTDPTDPYGRGTGITGAMKVEISADEAAAQYLDAHFKNRARPDIIISGSKESPMSKVDSARLEQTWLEKFRGSKRAGRPLFSASPLAVQEVGTTLRENMMADVRAELKQTIAEAYSIPPELLGRLESSNRATIESAEYLFAVHTVVPRLELLRDVLEPFCAAEFALGSLELKYDNPVPEDVTKTLDAMKAFPEDFSTNEVRVLVGRKALPGKDDMHEPKIPLMGMPGDDNDGGGPPKPGKKPKKKPTADEEDGKAAPAAVEKITLSIDDIVQVSEAHLDPMVHVEAVALMDKILRSLLLEYGGELLKELEAENVFALNARVAEWLIQRGSKLMGYVDDTTRDALRASLLAGAAKNETIEQLAERVAQLFADAAETRAALIGQTEATNLTGFGSLAGAEQAGMQRKMWLSSRDHVVRDSHATLNGQVKPINDPFVSPRGGRAQHPGAFGERAEDINCRCAMRPVLDGEKAFGKPEFEAWYEGARARVVDRIEETVRDIFAAQAVVVQTQLRRTLAGKI